MIAASMAHGNSTFMWMREICWKHLSEVVEVLESIFRAMFPASSLRQLTLEGYL